MKLICLCLVLFGVAALVNAEKFFGGSRALVDYCYSTDTDRPQYLRMNSKTAYQLVKGGQILPLPSGCTPTKFWLLSRHGTRLPGRSNIEKYATLPQYQAQILQNYADNKQPSFGALCEEDLQLLGSWKWDTNITTDKENFLTVQGWNDLKWLGEHYKAQYPTLLGTAYSADKFHFRHTNTQRALASFKGFVDGVWGDGAYNTIPAPEVPSTDTLLRPYDHCSKYSDQKEALDLPDSESTKFEEGPLYMQMIADVSAKAGYSSPLSPSEVKWMWEMCISNKAWELDKDSPWCSLFTLEQAKIFEYAKDIEEWMLGGSATVLNTRLGCEAMQEMLTRLDTLDGPSAIAYFAHSQTLQLFLTGLGYAFQDIPLRADNYEANRNRVYITSRISALATNVAVVRYDCSTGVKVQFLMNEKPLELDFCTNGLCDWEEVKSKYANIASQTCSSFYCSSASSLLSFINPMLNITLSMILPLYSILYKVSFKLIK